MMYVIKKSRLESWLKRLEEKISVVFPRVGSGRGSEMGPENLFPRPGAPGSIKGILMPLEELLCFGNEAVGNEGREEERLTLVWGVKPCDMKGVELIDKVFQEGFTDTLYTRRRSRLAFAGFACIEKGAACFCHLFGIDPASPSGMDLLVVEDGRDLLVRPMTPKGEEIASLDGSCLEECGESGAARMEALLSRIRERDRDEQQAKLIAASDPGELKKLSERLAGQSGSEVWSEIADTCLGCGICSFVCPLCWCFDVRDVSRGTMKQMAGDESAVFSCRGEDRQAVRIRCWDSCQLGHYGRMAGGADPYDDCAARTRHRIFHKFKYIPDEYGLPGCTGCGRCVLACPSGLDIGEILMRLAGEEKT